MLYVLSIISTCTFIDINALKNFVFTFKVHKGSKYGDFDHVLVKYRLWIYDDPDEWEILPVSHAIYTPLGCLPNDEGSLKRILGCMNTLGSQNVRRCIFGFNRADTKRLAEMAERLFIQSVPNGCVVK